MKKILLLSTLALFAIPSFAQVRDSNHSTSNTKDTDSNLLLETADALISRFDSIEIQSIVQEMRADGVKEKKYGALIGVDGKLIGYDGIWKDGTETKFVPFTVRISNDNSVQVTVAAIDFGNGSATNKKNILTKGKALVFKLDDGMEFRDIKSVGWRALDADIALPVVNRGRKSFIAILAGTEIGGSQETIILDDGQEIEIKGNWGNDQSGPDFEKLVQGNLGLQLNFRAGFEVSERVGQEGSLSLKGVVHYNNLYGGNPQVSNHLVNLNHVNMFAAPEVSYSTPMGKKSKITISLGANLNIFNKLNTNKHIADEEGYEEVYPEKIESIDLGNRSRQQVHGGIKLSF